MPCDAQLIVVVEEGGLGRILRCFLAFVLLLSTKPKGFLEVPVLRSHVASLGCSSLPTLLDRLSKIIVGGVAPRVLTRPRPSPFILIPKFTILDGGSRGHPIPHVSSRPSFFSQPGIVREEIGDVFGLLTDICALVLSILVDILEFLEGLDNVDVVTEIDDDVFRASVQAVIEKS